MNLTKEDIEAYAPRLLLVRHTGALLVWFQQTAFYRGEPEKLKAQLNSVTTKNLLVGWWSPVSLFVNPIVTIANWVRFNNYVKEYAQFTATPEKYIVDARQVAEGKAAKKARHSGKWLTATIVLVVMVVVLVIAGAMLDS